MPESGSSGSMRGVPSNGHPYRDPRPRPWKNVSCDVGDALCFSAVRVEAPEIELARAA
jgi:hypothetical protein